MPVDPQASKISLHMAAMSGDVKVVRALVRNPATDVNEKDLLGDSGLLKAARYGQLQVVEALLEAGANVNAQDNKGWTCLHTSIANNREKIFFAVLGGTHHSMPTDIEAVTSTGDGPLHMAAYHCRKWAVGALLSLGADRHATNDDNRRPVEVARHDDIRAMLLSCEGEPAGPRFL